MHHGFPFLSGVGSQDRAAASLFLGDEIAHPLGRPIHLKLGERVRFVLIHVVAVFWWAVIVEEASEWTVRNQRNNAVNRARGLFPDGP